VSADVRTRCGCKANGARRFTGFVTVGVWKTLQHPRSHVSRRASTQSNLLAIGHSSCFIGLNALVPLAVFSGLLALVRISA